jgi:hypothetical protein
MARTRHLHRLRLRTRLTLTFALGAAILSVTLSVVTWGLTRENLQSQKESTATTQVMANAVRVNNGLNPTVNVENLISSLQTRESSQPVIEYQRQWFSKSSLEFGRDALPQTLQQMVNDGSAASMFYSHDGDPFFVVGVPLPRQNAAYYEGVSLLDV